MGKTTAYRALQGTSDRCVFLDGDWCWDAHPFQVTGETKAMVPDNICHLLSNFLRWGMHRQDIIDSIRSRLDLTGRRVVSVSLACEEKELRRRLEQNI